MKIRLRLLILLCIVFSTGNSYLHYINYEDNNTISNSEIIAEFEYKPILETPTLTDVSVNSLNLDVNNVVHDGVVSGGEYDFTVSVASSFTLHYTVDGATIYIALVASGTGWVALGIDPDSGARMLGADIIIGYYDGTTNIRDDHGTSETKHEADTTGNILSSAAGESGGSTTLEYSRLLNTGDTSEDKIISVGVPTLIIWAYHSSSDGFTLKHGSATTDRGTTTVTFQEIITPGAPQSPLIAPTGSDGQVSLSWSAPSSDGGSPVTDYNIYRSTTSGGPYTQVGTTTSLSYVDSAVTNGIEYFYVIRAVNVKGEGSDSTEVSDVPIGAPSPPQNLSGTPGSGQVSLTWEAPVSDGGSAITGYTVKRSENNGGPYSTTVGTTGSLTLTDSSVSDGTTYYYIVLANNNNGPSGNSNQFQATPGSSPSAPQSLAATGGDNQVILNWSTPLSDGGSPILQYRVYRSLGNNASYINIDNTTAISFVDSTVINGNLYYYVLTAQNSLGEGAQSNEKNVIPSTIPGQPTGLTVTKNDTFVDLSWTAPIDNGGATLTGYKIYRNGSLLTTVGPSPTTYNDTGLINGKNYVYTVSATNDNGEGAQSTSANATPSTTPDIPTGLIATKGNANVSLSWTAPVDTGGSALTDFKIYRNGSLLTTISA
ncbi:MAG: fibronectin type III domain-containing protein, partial [Candidatus Kariarchaeaceae archaeon]